MNKYLMRYTLTVEAENEDEALQKFDDRLAMYNPPPMGDGTISCERIMKEEKEDCKDHSCANCSECERYMNDTYDAWKKVWSNK